ncbi:MAG TPA: c-type cytochrome [Polyangiaceae bacterium]
MQSSPGEKKKRNLATILGLNGGILCSLAILAAPADGCAPTADWCAVKPIVTNKCATCHTTPGLNGAPFPLRTYAEVQPHTARMQVRINLTSGQMPPATHPQLTQAEKDTLNAWINGGAPNNATCAP